MQNPDTLARPENPNPKWPVPKDLIELQPSYKQARFSIQLKIQLNCHDAFLPENLPKHALLRVQDDWDPDWQSTSSSKVSYLVQRLKALQESNKEKGYYNINYQVLAESSCPLVTRDMKLSFQHCPLNIEPNNMPEKVLIFSQFLEHIHVIERQVIYLFHILCMIFCEFISE